VKRPSLEETLTAGLPAVAGQAGFQRLKGVKEVEWN